MVQLVQVCRWCRPPSPPPTTTTPANTHACMQVVCVAGTKADAPASSRRVSDQEAREWAAARGLRYFEVTVLDWGSAGWQWAAAVRCSGLGLSRESEVQQREHAVQGKHAHSCLSGLTRPPPRYLLYARCRRSAARPCRRCLPASLRKCSPRRPTCRPTRRRAPQRRQKRRRSRARAAAVAGLAWAAASAGPRRIEL